MKTKTQEKESYTKFVHQGRIDIVKDIETLQKLEEPTENENYREPLEIATHIEKKILLSWGGPEDGFKLYFTCERSANGAPDLQLSHGLYYRADWGEYEESPLSESEAQTVYDFYLGGYAEI